MEFLATGRKGKIAEPVDRVKICNYILRMADLEWTFQGATFACDQDKNRANELKHGITLYGASPVFFDPNGYSRYDYGHSGDEDRHCFTGISANGNLVVIAYTLRNGVIRIISARKANRQEVKSYEEQCK